MGACWQKVEVFPSRASETREDATCALFTPKLAAPVNHQMSSGDVGTNGAMLSPVHGSARVEGERLA